MKGYIIHWANYSKGGFKEGVLLTVDDELNRWQKYSYGMSKREKKSIFHTFFTFFFGLKVAMHSWTGESLVKSINYEQRDLYVPHIAIALTNKFIILFWKKKHEGGLVFAMQCNGPQKQVENKFGKKKKERKI